MPEKIREQKPPRGIARSLFRFPIRLYQLGLGLKAIRDIAEEKLLEINEDQTIGEQLAGYGVHEAYHAGQIEITNNFLKS